MHDDRQRDPSQVYLEVDVLAKGKDDFFDNEAAGEAVPTKEDK